MSAFGRPSSNAECIHNTRGNGMRSDMVHRSRRSRNSAFSRPSELEYSTHDNYSTNVQRMRQQTRESLLSFRLKTTGVGDVLGLLDFNLANFTEERARPRRRHQLAAAGAVTRAPAAIDTVTVMVQGRRLGDLNSFTPSRPRGPHQERELACSRLLDALPAADEHQG